MQALPVKTQQEVPIAWWCRPRMRNCRISQLVKKPAAELHPSLANQRHLAPRAAPLLNLGQYMTCLYRKDNLCSLQFRLHPPTNFLMVISVSLLTRLNDSNLRFSGVCWPHRLRLRRKQLTSRNLGRATLTMLRHCLWGDKGALDQRQIWWMRMILRRVECIHGSHSDHNK